MRVFFSNVRFQALCRLGLIFLAVPFTLYAKKDTLTLVAFGDSITAGAPLFRSPAEFPPSGRGDERSQYAYWVRVRHPDWQIFNRGVSGERSEQIFSRFETDVLNYRPEIVIVMAGVNDLYQGLPARTVKENLAKIYERSGEAKIQVMALTILPYNGMSDAVRNRLEEINGWIRQYSSEHRLGFCDTHHVLEHPGRPGHLASTEDGLHPDVEGYKKLGDAVARCLEAWLENNRGTFVQKEGGKYAE